MARQVLRINSCYMQQVMPWAHQSCGRERHLDSFSRFCRAHWVTDRLTNLVSRQVGRLIVIVCGTVTGATYDYY